VSRVTSKLQVTIPKSIAQRYGIEPGEEIEWLPAGEAIRVVPHSDRLVPPDRLRRLELFDRATDRQHAREVGTSQQGGTARGWVREDLYERASSD
jgi:AbrB family looped-hinge helix DNA binding protein